MLKCESLNKVLNGNRNVNYFKFKNDILVFIKDYMKNINKNVFLYLPDVICMNNDEEYGYSYGNKTIGINESVIKNIYNGDRLALLHIFHELAHIKSVSLIYENIRDVILIDIIKEYLLYEISDDYYEDNYKYESSEIYANLEAINMFIDYFNDNDIKLKIWETCILMKNMYEYKKRLNNKMRKIYNKETKEYEVKLFYDYFDELICENKKWLNMYPQLELEYYIEGELVKKINKKI